MGILMAYYDEIVKMDKYGKMDTMLWHVTKLNVGHLAETQDNNVNLSLCGDCAVVGCGS